MKNEKSKIKNLFLAGTFAVCLIGASLALAKPTQAFWPFDLFKKNKQSEQVSDYPPIIQKLVEIFNLDGERVKEVFDEVREEKGQRRQERREEGLEALAEFLGMSTDEVKQAFEDGKTPADLAEEKGLNIEDFRDQMAEQRREYWREMGLSDEEIAEREEQMKDRREGGKRPSGRRRFWMGDN